MPDSLPSPPRATHSIYQLDQRQLNNIMPDIYDMANNLELLEQVRERRFNRDDPPSYRSPSPEAQDEAQAFPFTHRNDQIQKEIAERLDTPLNESELREAQSDFETYHPAYHPGRRYMEEADVERWRIDPDCRTFLNSARRAEFEQQTVYVRHRVKKRWERLGIWNPSWGIPGRVNERPEDDYTQWKWRWQGDTGHKGGRWNDYKPHHPNSRAFQLRANLRRGERGPLPPRSSLSADASKSTAEAFITSRPWYIYGMDVEDERTRAHRRLKPTERTLHDLPPERYVIRRWIENGDWRNEWYLRHDGNNKDAVPGWKWRHESPSPSPEPVELEDMDLSPSEIDALEAIRPQTPPAPRQPPVLPTNMFYRTLGESLFGPDPNKSPPQRPEVANPETASSLQTHEAQISARSAEHPPSSPPRPKRPREQDTPEPPRRVRRRLADKARNTTLPETFTPRRSARIAERARQLNQAKTAAQASNSAETKGRKKPASQKPNERKRPTKSTTAASAPPPISNRRRGRPPKSSSSQITKPREPVVGAIRRGRPPKSSPRVAKPQEPVVRAIRRGRPPKAVSTSQSTRPQGTMKRRGRPPKKK